MAQSTSLSLSNLLRGRLAEQIFAVLLERAGYRITRLGIEVLCDEVNTWIANITSPFGFRISSGHYRASSLRIPE